MQLTEEFLLTVFRRVLVSVKASKGWGRTLAGHIPVTVQGHRKLEVGQGSTFPKPSPSDTLPSVMFLVLKACISPNSTRDQVFKYKIPWVTSSFKQPH